MDRGKLNRALSSDDTPPPGYLYQEIARMTQAGPDVCLAVTDLVLSRLRRGNHNTKWKALLVIKQVCRLARSDFRKRLQRSTADIKECLQYRGPPDPLRGDAIYKRVREAAKDALEAIYNESEGGAGSGLPTSRIQGFGSSPPPGQYQQGAPGAGIGASVTSMAMSMRDRMGPGDGSYTGGSERRMGDGGNFQGAGMQGFGNPNMPDYRGQKTMMERVGEGVLELGKQVSTQVPSLREMRMPGSAKTSLFDGPPGSMPSNRGPHAERWMGGGGYEPHGGGGGGGGGGNGYHANSTPAPASSYYQQPQGAAAFSSGGLRTRGQVGGSWGRGGPGAATPAPPQSMASPPVAPPVMNGGGGQAGGAASDGSYERQKVQELCAAGGLRAVPPKAELDDFVAECETLDAYRVVPVLLDVMQEGEKQGQWRVTAKALVVAEALAKRHPPYRTLLASEEAVDLLVPCAESEMASVRDRAMKLLKILGVELEFEDDEEAQPSQEQAVTGGIEASPGSAPPSVPAPVPQPEMDLLGGYGDAPLAAPLPPPAPVASGAAEGGAAASMGATASTTATSAAAAMPANHFGEPFMEASVSSGPAPAAESDLFSGLSTPASTAKTQNGAAQPPPPVAQASDMFAELSVKAATPPPAAVANGSAAPAAAPSPATSKPPSAPKMAPVEQSLMDFSAPELPMHAATAPAPAADPLHLLDPLFASRGPQGGTADPSMDLLAPPGPPPHMPTDPVQAQLLQLAYQNQLLQQQMRQMAAGGMPPQQIRNHFSAMSSPTAQQRPNIPDVGVRLTWEWGAPEVRESQNLPHPSRSGSQDSHGLQRAASGGSAEGAFGFGNASGQTRKSTAFDFVNDELAKKR